MNFHNTNWQSRNNAKTNILIFMLFIFTLSIPGILFYIVYIFFQKIPVSPISPLNTNSTVVNPTTVPDKKPKLETLTDTINSTLDGTTGNYGIAVKNLKSGESFTLNAHRVYEPGSLYKIWVMAVVYSQIQTGSLLTDQILINDVANLNEKFQISTAAAELTDGTITFSIEDALNQMITNSHNYAALLLTEKVGLSKVASFLKEFGFHESTVGTDGAFPTTTASDITLFFEKLYQGDLANEKYTEKMMTLLKNQELNHKLPKYLPSDAVVAHKTGELGLFTHDAGIVFIPDNDYIITVLSESDTTLEAEERISILSKAVFDYFSN